MTTSRRRAQRRSRMRSTAQRRPQGVLEGREHGAMLDLVGFSAFGAAPARSWFFPRSAGQPQRGVGKAGAPMSRTRSRRSAPQRRTRGRRASSRLGQASALRGADLVVLRAEDERGHAATAAGTAPGTGGSGQRKPSPLVQPRCSTTASLRATATLARRIPPRRASAKPHSSRGHMRGWRWSSTVAASNR